MKPFRQDINNFYICEECNKSYSLVSGLIAHTVHSHNGKRDYYNKWILEGGDGKCLECGKETKLDGTKILKFCSKSCSSKYRLRKNKSPFCNPETHIKSKATLKKHYGVEHYSQSDEGRANLKLKGLANSKETMIKVKKTCLKKYGVENPFQSEKIKNKIKQTCLKNHGVEYISQSKEIQEKAKQTCLKKYGVEYISQSNEIKEKVKKTCQEKYGVDYVWQSQNIINKTKAQNKEIQSKKRKTCQERYGVEYSMQSDEIQEKRKETWLEKYGVENPSQLPEISEKTFKTQLLIKKFNNTNLWYQSSYELDFLNIYYNLFKKEIKRGPSIKYVFNNKNKVYHPDFYIPSLNLVVECKNSWLMKRDKEQILEKKKATLKNGFNYIIIIDKDYNKFNKILLKNELIH